MNPNPRFMSRFTKEGRLEQQISQAYAEKNINTSLLKLREIQQQLLQDLSRFAKVWLIFLDIYLGSRYIKTLTNNDLQKIETLAIDLLSNPMQDLDTVAVWSRLIHAYLTRGHKQHALDLITYRYMTITTSSEWRIWAVQCLVEQGATGDHYVDIYADFLTKTPEDIHRQNPTARTVILNLLQTICTIDFDADPTRIRRANATTNLLTANNIAIESRYNTFGIYTLLIEQDAEKANKHFITAHELNPNDKIALRGLFATWLRCNRSQKVIDKVQEIKHHKLLTDPIIQGLLKINALNQWLDSYSIAGPPPYEISEIEMLLQSDIPKYVGDQMNATLGRLHLTKGNVQQADQMLREFSSKHPEQHRWRYYTTWTAILLGKKECITYNPEQAKSWPEYWAVACLLLDAYPEDSQKNKLLAYINNKVQTKDTFKSIIKARLAMVDAVSPLEIQWQPGKGSIEEDIEAFRTILGHTLFTKSFQRARELRLDPLFQRLPLPDRLMWSGLILLQTEENIQNGCMLLERAARKFGYQRAALVLATYYIKQKNLAKAKQFLDQTPTTPHTKTLLLQAIIQATDGKVLDMTLKKCEYAASKNEPGANYVLGSLYLREGRLKQAAQAFGKAPINSNGSQQWSTWIDLLEYLQNGHPRNHATLNKYYASLKGSLTQLPTEVAIALVQALIKLCQQVEDIEQANIFTYLLMDFSHRIESPTVQHLCQIGVTVAIYAAYIKIPTRHEQQIQQYIASLLKKDSTNSTLAILLAHTYLLNEQVKDALTTLRNVHPKDEKELWICLQLVKVLGSPIQSSLQINVTEQEQTISLRLLKAISLLFNENQLQGSQAILRLLESSDIDVQTVLKRERIIPLLCLYAIKEKSIEPQVTALLRKLIQQHTSPELAGNIARYAAAMGKLELAYAFLHRKGVQEKEFYRQILIDLRWYMAVKAYQDKDVSHTIRRLQEILPLIKSTEQKELQENIIDRLELRVFTERLLVTQFPNHNIEPIYTGRYYCIEQIITQNKPLRQALLYEDKREIKASWGKIVEQYRMSPRIAHIRALIYREFALNGSDHDEHLHTLSTSTAFWVSLLCAEFFWTYFSRERIFDEQGERIDLDSWQQEDLFTDAIDTLLSYHSDTANKAFQECQYEQAKTHFYCLDICRQGGQKLLHLLQTRSITFAFPLDPQRLEYVSDKAEKHLNQWSATLIRQAEKALQDPDRIKTLPQGMPLNYEGAISLLEPFIHLEIPILRILTRYLDWHNQWCHKLSWQGNVKHIQELVEQAKVAVEQIIPLLVEGQGYKLKNQILSKYFFWHGYSSAYDTNKSIVAFKAALLWNPTNTEAKDYLEKRQAKLEQEQKNQYLYSDSDEDNNDDFDEEDEDNNADDYEEEGQNDYSNDREFESDDYW